MLPYWLTRNFSIYHLYPCAWRCLQLLWASYLHKIIMSRGRGTALFSFSHSLSGERQHSPNIPIKLFACHWFKLCYMPMVEPIRVARRRACDNCTEQIYWTYHWEGNNTDFQQYGSYIGKHAYLERNTRYDLELSKRMLVREPAIPPWYFLFDD